MIKKSGGAPVTCSAAPPSLAVRSSHSSSKISCFMLFFLLLSSMLSAPLLAARYCFLSRESSHFLALSILSCWDVGRRSRSRSLACSPCRSSPSADTAPPLCGSFSNAFAPRATPKTLSKRKFGKRRPPSYDSSVRQPLLLIRLQMLRRVVKQREIWLGCPET